MHVWENFTGSRIIVGVSRCRGARGRGKLPPETENIVVEKWLSYPELYKMTKGRKRDGSKKDKKSIFH